MRLLTFDRFHQLTFFPSWFPVNSYLVEDEEALTLIDCALPFSSRGIIQAAEQLGKPVTRIVLTHPHSDHVGALDAVKQKFRDAAVIVSRRDARLLAGKTDLDPDEPQMPIRGGIPKNVKTIPDQLVQDGDTIGSLQVVSCPGHTPGHMALFDKRSGALFAGDAFQTRAGIAVSGQIRPLFPFPALATWNKKAACVSARKLSQLKPRYLAVGHGNVLEYPEQAMARALTQAEQKLGMMDHA
ncbi:MBL fold metallo-hydrolase [Sporolactobacillus sp. THM19-2]|uniref:MBL fold metallo-hydrolase n=1 Tax=Sporolactobacillus sp. THM19-2 TaxID=2511171 RepID=UPI00101F55F4|nr:MBL fold metallo-hydrolase [Sporolactobacillus sp. THM19-2]RYL91652.1 MBL fold metallo-hydrolase [Sporolactobacillus sp. THM19-2]